MPRRCGPDAIQFAFDVTNPEAQRWAATRSSSLIVEITREARAAVRAVMEQAFAEGLAPREAAVLIRDIVGLTERDALAVMRRQLADLASGMDPAKARARAEKYAGKLHRARALTIARTETMAASNQGQQELWDQAIAAGHLDPRLMKMWIVTDDEDLCDICAPMRGVTVGIQESFGEGPPKHPNCRCTVGLVNA